MTTTQHPLTDEQAFALAHEHPLIPDFARAAFDAGREHEREHAAQDRPAEVTTEAIRREVEYAVRTAAAHGYSKGKWGVDRSEPIQALIKSAGAALSADFAVALPAAPHHDPRPWQDCTEVDVREGDLVERPYLDIARFGVAHHQDPDGHWRTKGGILLTCADGCPLRRIPAHTTEKDTPMTETTTPAEPVNSQAVAPGPRERITNEIAEWLEIETRKGGYSYLHMGCGHTMNLDPETRAALVASLAGAETTPTPADVEPLARALLAVPAGHGAPHHDEGEIQAGDFVAQVDRDGFTRGGIAHRQDDDGDWYTKGGKWITWAALRASRPDAITVWPAPTPPAVEVEMPTEHPAHLRDVEGWDGERFAYMALNADGRWCGVDQDGVARVWLLRWIAAATLPDGTRARRDGTHADGEPRFVKVQEAEK